MTALVQTYSAFTHALDKSFDNFIQFFERLGRARAAAELTRQGYYEEAKRLMLEQKES